MNLENIKEDIWLVVVLLIVGTLFPGGLFVYLFNPTIFYEFNIVKLIFTSFMVTIPILTCSSIILAIGGAFTGKDNSSLDSVLGLSVLLSMPILYIPLVIRYFFNIPLKVAIIIILSVELACFILVIFRAIKNFKK